MNVGVWDIEEDWGFRVGGGSSDVEHGAGGGIDNEITGP